MKDIYKRKKVASQNPTKALFVQNLCLPSVLCSYLKGNQSIQLPQSISNPDS